MTPDFDTSYPIAPKGCKNIFQIYNTFSKFFFETNFNFGIFALRGSMKESADITLSRDVFLYQIQKSKTATQATMTYNYAISGSCAFKFKN